MYNNIALVTVHTILMMVVSMKKKAMKQSNHDEDVHYTSWNVAYAQATTNPWVVLYQCKI